VTYDVLWEYVLDDIDAAVARHRAVDPDLLKTHGHRAGAAKVVAVALETIFFTAEDAEVRRG